ncbi:glycosyl hydrolase family 17 protein [Bacteroidia bacterium]|nr:glycosyl hydrolase family 17 protein [Bacteroidia bacterium]
MNKTKTASQILGNPKYLAISYGGYRETSRDIQPTIQQLKNDMKILAAMGIKVLRTYNVQLNQAPNLLKAISEMRQEDPEFEMYVMLGIWIDCVNAWTDQEPNHDVENESANAAEVQRAVNLAGKYPDIVKILAVGNEAMVKWATSYFVQPNVILKWVNHLQDLKKEGTLDKDLWITSSDNFASWGGGDTLYHCEDLEKLIKAVDYVSLHTYPMHDTHYNPVFWGTFESELHLPRTKAIERVMKRAIMYAKKQYANTKKYVHSIDSTKLLHIGETGWATVATGHYGNNGSRACDEYKEGVYYKQMRKWTNKNGISCFFFEAFNEKWKDVEHAKGSENHFGLIKINGQAKHAVWDLVDKGVFDGLTRNGKPIKKTYEGNLDSLLTEVELPPVKQLK